MGVLDSNVIKLMEHSPNAILTVDRQGQILIANIRACQLFGYEASQLVGQPVEMLIPAAIARHHVKLRSDYVIDATPRAMGSGRELQAQHASGELIDVEVSLNPYADDEGQTVGVIATVIDIRPRLEQEARLKHQVESLEEERKALLAAERNMASIIEYSPNAVLTMLPNGCIDMVNACALKLFGYSREEMCGQPIELLLPDSLRHHHVGLRNGYIAEPFECYLDAGRSLKGRHKDGSLIDIEIALAPLRDASGKLTSVIATLIDIRQRLASERTLARQIEDLTRINEELDRFAYVASHDLKSPLNAIQKIIGWVREDCDELLPETSRNHLNMLDQRAGRLMRLLDDLLAYSRASRQEYELEKIDLCPLVEEIFTLQGEPKGFTCDSEPCQLWIQRTPFETVLTNLISNAIKHHDLEEGKIHVSCETQGEDYLFCIEDDGPGIPPALHHKALAMFQTLQPRDRVEGSGMGLALVKKIVEHHKGDMRIDSDGTRGTRILIRWPRPTAKKNA
ncbi:sensor histidine kinase [Pokkaliibacter sp. CJK22405]|uniref:sensor histidine kinase n=1 Tax=Pokkaliibacter sp. CJK22405 TaxID=3384615 RepID=UPI0039848CC2